MARLSREPKGPRVAIVGRPNVGKSTLFNRILGVRKALVGDEPGITRDRLYARAQWQGRFFEVVDTGGMLPDEKHPLPAEIFRHAWKAIEEATLLILVVDGRQGVVSLDEELAQRLVRVGKPLALAVNKLDTPALAALAADFARLGIGNVFSISAEHGLGVDGLLEWLTNVQAGPRATRASMEPGLGPAADNFSLVPEAGESSRQPELLRLAIIGRPNAGKSTLLNRLVGEERALVTPVAGTTRDAVEALIVRNGQGFEFIDTAGIRRKGKTEGRSEKVSVLQAQRRLERADLALVVLDAVEGLTALDSHIAGYAHHCGRSVILVVNKWDAIENHAKAVQKLTATIRRRMKFLDYAPIAFVSALRGQRMGQLWDKIVEVAAARWRRIPTSEMNAFLKTLPPELASRSSHRPVRIFYLTQAGVAPPIFVAFTHGQSRLHFSSERFLENRIREHFGFAGTPIVIKCRPRR